MFYVSLVGTCNNQKNFTAYFAFRDEEHFSAHEDTQFDELIDIFNALLPPGQILDDPIEVKEVFGTEAPTQYIFLPVD